MYLMLKHIHLLLVFVSIAGFLARVALHLFEVPFRNHKLVKVLPHIVDTALLLSAIALCIVIGQYPFVDAWLTVKLFAVIAYILIGVATFRFASSMKSKLFLVSVALLVLIYIAGLAFSKNYLWFS